MLNSFPVFILVGTLLGYLSGLGVGGGSLLILWLTMILHTPIQVARTINLLFFLPAAAISCIFRRKQGDLPFLKLLPAILSGTAAAIVGTYASSYIKNVILSEAMVTTSKI